jgi:hypothetical protein
MCAAPSGFFPAMAAASEGNPVSQKQWQQQQPKQLQLQQQQQQQRLTR